MEIFLACTRFLTGLTITGAIYKLTKNEIKNLTQQYGRMKFNIKIKYKTTHLRIK